MLNDISKKLMVTDAVWQRCYRLKRILKRRWNYMKNLLSYSNPRVNTVIGNPTSQSLKPGDLVRVRSKEEIQNTLNRWNQLKGCSFMEEMKPYCGTIQRVLKRVGKFLDERDYLIKKCKGIVILDGVFCEGTKDFGSCDRTCFFFWREEWFELIEK